jgi:hypothetical protein
LWTLFGSVDADGPGFNATVLLALVHDHNAEGYNGQERAALV